MTKPQLLHSRPVVSTSTTPVDSLGYYAHAVALLILFCLWRIPIASGKSAKTPHADVKFHSKFFSPRTEIQEAIEIVTSQDDDDEVSFDHEELEHLFPTSTAAERRRFITAKIGDKSAASTQLASYIEWREKHDAIEKEIETSLDDTDEAAWNRSATIALVACCEPYEGPLPRLARMYHVNGSTVCDRDGYRLLHVMPGQIDINLARASTYALALALYIDRKLERSSTELITVLLDVRGGKGWPNIPPYRQLPFIQTVTKLLLSMFPERLYQCLLYPLPPAAFWIWNIAKVWIDPLTASKINLLSGVATIVSPPPYEQMEEFLDSEVAKMLEEERLATFEQ